MLVCPPASHAGGLFYYVHFVDIVRRPYMKAANQSAPYGLDFLGFHDKLVGHMFSRRAKRRGLSLCPFLAMAASKHLAVHMSTRLI